MQADLVRFQIFCQPEGLLVLSARRGAGNVMNSLDYIPGTTLRGALAALYGEMPGPLDWNLFRAGVYFPDLTPSGGIPIPRSALTCKHARGFRQQVDSHGVVDVLLFPRPSTLRCERCDADLKPHRGWMLARDAISEPPLHRTATLHTAIHHGTRSANPGLFYLEESIYTTDGFRGELWAATERVAEVQELLGEAVRRGLKIGHGRSKGLGRVTVFLETPDPDAALPTADSRIRGMQEMLRNAPDHRNDAAFSVTLRSRAILLDEYLRFRAKPSLADFHFRAASVRFTELLATFRPRVSYTATEPVFGWNLSANLPKSPDSAIAAGACYLYGRRDQPLTDGEISVLATGFTQLEAQGIGERVEEGFGRVTFCDPFHWRSEGITGSVNDGIDREKHILH